MSDSEPITKPDHPSVSPPVAPPDMKPPVKNIKTPMDPQTKRWIIIGSVVAILVIGVGVALALTNKSTPSQTVIATDSPSPTPSPVPSILPDMLDGTMVTPALATRHPLAIMVENTPDARPQSGLSSASIVYEAIVEGGITRFMAVYGPVLPAKVGPVRSTRQVYVDLIKEYTPVSAYYGHVGGAPDALAAIQNQKLYDLNQFTVGSAAYQRFPKAGLAIEHTMYTFPDKLYAVAAKDGYQDTSTFRPWLFKDDAPAESRPASQVITVPFSGGTYDATYTYNTTTNTYKRSVQGVPFNDALTGQALAPKNLVIEYAGYDTRPGDVKGRQDVDVSSGGKAKILEDGQVIAATWAKDKTSNRTIFTNSATGKEIQFNRGQIFVEIIKSTSDITVK